METATASDEKYVLTPEMAERMVQHFTPAYRVVRAISSGNFGHVFLLRDNLKSIAVKIVPLEKQDADHPQSMGDDWYRIQTLASRLHHPSLVRVRDFFRYHDPSPSSSFKSYGLIYMDYWPANLRGCIRRLIRESIHTPARKFVLLRNLANLLASLKEDANLLVTDLKLGNILVGDMYNQPLALAIADLGGVHRSDMAAVSAVEGTNTYWPPELHDGSCSVMDETALMFSFGIIAFFIMEGRKPLDSQDGAVYLALREHGGADWNMPLHNDMESIMSIVDRCLSQDRQSRPQSFRQVAQQITQAHEQWLNSQEKQLSVSLPAQPKPGETWREPATGMEFVWVPGGRFMMGQSEQERATLLAEQGEQNYQTHFAREIPCHAVMLDGFWMGKYPVLRREFALFAETSLYLTDAEQTGAAHLYEKGSWWKRSGVSWRDPGFQQSDAHPVVCISWLDAVNFAGWLRRRTGVAVSLPSEAQWEHACRAGTETAYSFGDALKPSNACYGRTSALPGAGYGTSPAGQFQANSFGLCDMHGNVWEWCKDGMDAAFYGSEQALQPNPLSLQETAQRIRRGGSWAFGPHYLRSAYRGKDAADACYTDIGFRMVISPLPR